jgi:hypothetical protein
MARRPSVPMERTPLEWSAKWFADFCRDAIFVPLRLDGFTVATLPAGKVGEVVYVTDALAPAFGVAVAGGGAVVCPVFYTGTAWVVR